MNDVFISYKAEEFEEANWVKQTLENNGISCWMAPMSISGGSSYAVEIPQAIRSCKVFVLILSKKAQLSKWVPRELDQAINENKTIMPFMLENCALKDDFNFYLTNVQRYAAYESKSTAIEKMINEIRAILGIEQCQVNNEVKFERVENSKKALPKITNKQELHINKKPQKNKKKFGRKFNKKVWLLLLAVIPIIVLISILSKALDRVSIAGVKYDKDSYTIEINNAEVSNEDLKTLSNLKSLYTLKIIDSKISGLDFSLLKSNTLDSLYIENSNLTDEQVKSIDLKNITEISFAKNNILDLSSLKFSDELISLNMDGNKISNVLSLSVYNKLQSLSVSDCGLISLSGLETCIELKSIDVSNNELSNLNGLENTTLLEDVILKGNKISDISLLNKSSATLKRLIADDNSISTLNAIKDCKLIADLSLNNNKLENLKELSNISSIVNLSVKNNNLYSLSGLENNIGIKYLNVSDNAIADTSPISSIVSEEKYSDVTLVLSNNNISLLNLPKVNYKLLAIQNNKINDYSSLYDVDCRELIFDYHPSIDFNNLKDKNDNCYIIGCPLDKQVTVKEILGQYYTNFITEKDVADIIVPYLPSRLTIN